MLAVVMLAFTEGLQWDEVRMGDSDKRNCFKPRLNFQVLVWFSSTSPVDLQCCGSFLRKRGPFPMLVSSWVCYCKH